MKCLPGSEVADLVPTRCPRGHNQRRRLFFQRRKQAQPGDLGTDVEVIFFVAERSGHAAAGRVEGFDSETGDELQRLCCSTDRGKRFLVAVPVQQCRAPVHWGQRQIEAARLASVPLQFSDNLERDLREASLFVYITHSEGLGSAVLLAMSAGLPVVTSDTGGLREVIRDRVDGLLVENSAAAIAAAIQEVVERPDFARQLGCEARRTVEARFTCDLMVRRTMQVYREVLL